MRAKSAGCVILINDQTSENNSDQQLTKYLFFTQSNSLKESNQQ